MSDRSALITGASRGIGLGIATRMAELGYSLTITARDQAALDNAVTTLRSGGAPQVIAIAADLADRDAADRVIDAHAERYTTMNALVLNAGVGTAGSIADYPMRRFDKTLDVNFRTPFQILQRAMPLLRSGVATDPERGARVIALASITGVYAEANLAVYGAAKSAMISLIETLNAEESSNGISGTSIAPGYVDTDMSDWTKDKIPADSMIRVDDIVALAASLLELSSRAVVPRIVVNRAGAGLGA
ncbi:SDR family oxidoreductase [Mycolicibacterium wolinskyi]|uniref:Short-chain dehydrogenase n=1 Tax=Mycolicibacterium wolinskyi TaxID=59750 RepID=A0A1X2F1X3_9MYCO|nr:MULTISPECIES: SDR family oxidoreductase [Mycolicibacterium]MCV7287804.1 SDR family oxidoreductase [Mycolicibacterium wolinskyi]MCV7294702.1 SDR family oxidoreductase [Mycolicibacterium goodii]ORX12433.1 short-chain dehydrogenase [Mycolicibacterium wolinskyi]